MSENNQSMQPMCKEEIIQDIEELTKEPGFLYSLAVLLQHELLLNPEELADINWRERLSFQEISFLIGLMVKHQIDYTLPSNEKAAMLQVRRVYGLFEKLHKVHNEPFFDKLIGKMQEAMTPREADKSHLEIFGSGDLMIEPIFYGGSGAYDFQYLEFAEKKYKKDGEWIRKNKGVDLETMTKIAAELKKLNEHKAMTFPKTETFDDFCRATLDIFCFKSEDIDHFGTESATNFLVTFSLVPGSVNKDFNTLGAYNAVDSHPVVQLQKNHFFLPVGFSLTQSIYESPFYWMNSDTSYSDSASKHRGETTEEITYEMLASVFGQDNVYKNVRVCKNKQEITDIDVLAIAGNKAIIIQAKSKKLTELSKCGNGEKLRADFKEAVQKAYDQGLLCRASVIDKNNTLLTSDNKRLHLNEFIDDAYIICLTSDHYPAITHQVNVYLKKTPADPYPLAMSIFDLDILVFYLTDPLEFLYYLRQRVKLSDYYIASSEITLLGCHLRQKLFPHPNVNREALDEEFAQLIDANFPAMRGHHPKTEATGRLHHRWKNDKFRLLTEQVKATKQLKFTDAIFFLYDLAGEGADNLIKMIEETKNKTNQDRQQHDFSMIFEKGRSGVTFLSLADSSPEILESKLMPLAIARKYKTEADEWLALGSVVGSPNIIDAIAYNKQPWKEDADTEALTKVALKQGIPMNLKRKKVGRNDPCYCGSKKKFKKCCGK